MSVFYPHSGRSRRPTAAAVAFVVVGSVAAARSARARRYVTFGWLWYVGTLVPVIGLVQVGMQARADRYTYVPLIGLFVAIVWECAERAGTRRVPRMAISVAACAVIAAFGVKARAQVAHWANDVTLWGQALEVHPDNYYAHFSLGRVDLQHGRRDDAMAHLERALELAPWFAEGHDAMGLAVRQGRTVRCGHRASTWKRCDGSRDCWRRDSIWGWPTSSEVTSTWLRSSTGRRFAGRRGKRRSGRRSLTCSRRRASSMRRWRSRAKRCASIPTRRRPGTCSGASWRPAACPTRPSPNSSALSHRSRHSLPAQSMLATLLLGRGRVDEAIEHLRGAVRAEPDSAGARAALGSALAGHGRLGDAISEYDEAVRLAPGDAELRHALGLCLARQGRIPDAVVQLSEAVRVRPDSDALQVSLGMALSASGDARDGRGAFQSGAETQPRTTPTHTRASRRWPGRLGEEVWVFQGKRVVVVMPAYNAARTLRRTYDEVMAQGVVDLVIVVDDASRDETVAVARTLPHDSCTSIPRTAATAPTRRPATAWRWRRARTSSSWSIPTTNTRPS